MIKNDGVRISDVYDEVGKARVDFITILRQGNKQAQVNMMK